jgi:8-oxo-dGTP pyrophosphatase MutT (NUDIX family)
MKQYTRIEPTDIYQVGGVFKRPVVVKRFRTDDGNEHEFTTIYDEGRMSAAVIALTPDNQVITSRQFRAGRERYLDEIPGGAVENGEEPEQAARRELLEEAGYVPGHMELLGTYSWDAYSNVVGYYYFATDCTPAPQRVVEQIEIDQGMETVLISVDELLQNAKHDNMSDVAAVFYAYDQLQERR